MGVVNFVVLVCFACILRATTEKALDLTALSFVITAMSPCRHRH